MKVGADEQPGGVIVVLVEWKLGKVYDVIAQVFVVGEPPPDRPIEMRLKYLGSIWGASVDLGDLTHVFSDSKSKHIILREHDILSADPIN